MSPLAELDRLFRSEPWQNRIAYAFLLLLALLYLITQIAMVVVWIVGQAQLDIV